VGFEDVGTRIRALGYGEVFEVGIWLYRQKYCFRDYEIQGPMGIP
jgi:hypothetical protein